MSEEDKNKNVGPANNEPNNKDENNNGPRKPKFNIYWFYGLIIAAILIIPLLNNYNQSVKSNWKEFLAFLEEGDVQRVVIVNDQVAEIYIKPERITLPRHQEVQENNSNPLSGTGPHYYFNIGSVESFERRLEEAQEGVSDSEMIYAESEIRNDIFGNIMEWLLPIIILVAVWLFIFRRMTGGGGAGGGAANIFNVGKSKAKIFDKESNVKVDFTHVAGLEEAKQEVIEIVDFLKNPQKYTDLGGKIPKGALLVGPPGTGKTLLAKAVAGEAHVPFFSLSGSDFVEMFVGVGASRVRDLFKQAKEKAPCIVFIDEIDAIGRARGKNPNFGSNDERENTLNQLLTEMDGFGSNQGVIILAATNRGDVLDRALLRPGRFDRQIHVELPDVNERKQIFKVHLAPIKLPQGFDMDFLAQQTPGFSGADIANVCNEAALIAARKNKTVVEKQDFLDSIDRIVGGLERKNKIITAKEKRAIAFHEAGHATVSWFLEYANPLVKVTIIPRGKSLGAAWYLPEERQISTTEQMLDEMCATLGGRASEDIVFGQISTGALNDLERVTKQAHAMVAYFGLSKALGNKSYYDSSGQNEYSFTKPYSEKTAEQIDKEVDTIIAEQYKRAKEILTKNQKGLAKLADKLLEKEVIFREDLVDIFGERPFESREEQIIKETAKKAGATVPGKDKTEKAQKGGSNNSEEKKDDSSGEESTGSKEKSEAKS
ncbi:MAG: ATP-dependent zinc metalloprotease FtsH [Bacteroidetes bacterium]|jgi:cell division protease FtsH|nr:ATP-dependent zinc metalloprotease FtsH [Bacteroidota bacterium]